MGNACGRKPDIIHKEVIATDNSKKYSSRWDVDFKDIEDNRNILKGFPLFEYLYILLNHNSNSEGNEKKTDETISSISYEKVLTNKVSKHHLIMETVPEADFHLYEDYFKKIYDNLLLYAQWIRNDESITNLKKLDVIPFALLNCAATLDVKVNLFYSLFSEPDGNFVCSRDLMEFIFLLLATPSAVCYLSLKDISGLYPGKIIFKGDAESLMSATEHKDYKSLMSATVKALVGKPGEKISREEFFKRIVDYDWMFTCSGIRKRLDDSNEERDRLKREKEVEAKQA
jgi:hypothetical protein